MAEAATGQTIALHDAGARGDEMRALLRTKDWAKTPLGPMSGWPQSLQTALDIMLESGFGMVVAWGSEFRLFYNDRYRPVLGARKHPGALGAASKDIFTEAWPFIGPLFEQTREGKTVALEDVLIPLHRDGYLENCYFTLSYSPIHVETGEVGGMLGVVAETTLRVESERRLATLTELARRSTEATSEEQACQAAAAVLALNPVDVPFAALYLVEADGRRARRVATTGLVPGQAAAPPGVVDLEAGRDDPWRLSEVARSGTQVVRDLDRRSGPLPGGPYPEPTHTAAVLALSHPRPGQPYGFFIAGVSPRRALDEPYRRFFELASDHIATAIHNARAAEEERRRLRAEGRVNETLSRLGASFATELDEQRLLQLITDETTALTGADFGAFFFNVTNERGESYMLYTLSGAPREAFSRFPMPRNTAIFAPTFQGAGVVRLGDVTRDPRYGKMAPHHGMPEGHLPVRSYLAVPVVTRAGEVLGGLFFGRREVDRFDENHERIVVGVAAQAAIALENARLYKTLRESEQRAREADRRKDEFLAMLGHELRNPLAPIVTALQLMKLRAGDAAQHERAILERQVGHLSRLVDDLLDVSRITRGKIELKRQRIDLASAIAKGIEMAAPLLESRAHRLHVSAEATELPVLGDPIRLAQVVANLVNNAAKYTERAGNIHVKAWREAGHAALAVRDDGVGIDPELLPRIFELFTQGSRSLDRAQGGLGLGLSVVKSLVELHGGSVRAASAGPGTGSTFTVRLPLASSTVAETPQARAGDATPPRQPIRVLVVDDNQDAAELIAEGLRTYGLEARAVYDPLAALQQAPEFRPQVALLDIGLPVIDGFQLAQQLRGIPGLEGLRLIAITGYGQSSDRSRSADAGFDDHLVKPIELESLLETVERVIGSTPVAPPD